MTKAAPRGLLMLQSETNTQTHTHRRGSHSSKCLLPGLLLRWEPLFQSQSRICTSIHMFRKPLREHPRNAARRGADLLHAPRSGEALKEPRCRCSNECIHDVLETRRGVISAPRHHIKPDTRSLRGKQWRLVSTKASTGGGEAQVGLCSAAPRDVL